MGPGGVWGGSLSPFLLLPRQWRKATRRLSRVQEEPLLPAGVCRLLTEREELGEILGRVGGEGVRALPPSLCSPPLNTCDPVTAASSPYTTEAFSPPRKQVLCVHTLKGRERLGKGTRGREPRGGRWPSSRPCPGGENEMRASRVRAKVQSRQQIRSRWRAHVKCPDLGGCTVAGRERPSSKGGERKELLRGHDVCTSCSHSRGRAGFCGFYAAKRTHTPEGTGQETLGEARGHSLNCSRKSSVSLQVFQTKCLQSLDGIFSHSLSEQYV